MVVLTGTGPTFCVGLDLVDARQGSGNGSQAQTSAVSVNLDLRNTERVLTNAAVEKLLATEKALGDEITFADIAEEVAGGHPRILRDGEMDAGGWSCGMVAGLIHDVPTVKELIDRIMADADQIIRQRLVGFLDNAPAKESLSA